MDSVSFSNDNDVKQDVIRIIIKRTIESVIVRYLHYYDPSYIEFSIIFIGKTQGIDWWHICTILCGLPFPLIPSSLLESGASSPKTLRNMVKREIGTNVKSAYHFISFAFRKYFIQIFNFVIVFDCS